MAAWEMRMQISTKRAHTICSARPVSLRVSDSFGPSPEQRSEVDHWFPFSLQGSQLILRSRNRERLRRKYPG
eukprot:1397059-Rhodomonas_salina.6